MPKSEKVLARHPEKGKQGTNIDKDKYDSMQAALLDVIPRGAVGVSFGELPRLVQPHLPKAIWEGASVSWYVTTMKLDLEARGLIERVAGARPQRVRRV